MNFKNEFIQNPTAVERSTNLYDAHASPTIHVLPSASQSIFSNSSSKPKEHQEYITFLQSSNSDLIQSIMIWALLVYRLKPMAQIL